MTPGDEVPDAAPGPSPEPPGGPVPSPSPGPSANRAPLSETRAELRATRKGAPRGAGNPPGLTRTHRTHPTATATEQVDEEPTQGQVPLAAVVPAVALAVLIGLSALVGSPPTALAVGFAAVVMVWGWVVLSDAPSPRTALPVIGAGVVAISLAAGLTRTDPYLVWVPVAVAVSVIGAFLHQVLRAHGRPRLTDGVVTSVAALAVTASAATLVALPHYPHGGAWVLMAMVAVAVASAAQLLARWTSVARWVLVPVLVLGAAAAVGTAALSGGIPLLGAALAGLLVSAISHALLRVLMSLERADVTEAAVAAGAASVLVVGVVVYLLARLYAR